MLRSPLTEEHIALVHYQLFADGSHIRTKARYLQVAGIQVFQPQVREAIFLGRLFLLCAVDCYLIKPVFRHHAHLLAGVK